LKDKILVSRESAHLLQSELSTLLGAMTASGPREVVLDFEGVEGIAPSFLDELISILEAQLRASGDRRNHAIVLAHPPARLSLKFEAVARGHKLSVQTQADGSWRLSCAADELIGRREP